MDTLKEVVLETKNRWIWEWNHKRNYLKKRLTFLIIGIFLIFFGIKKILNNRETFKGLPSAYAKITSTYSKYDPESGSSEQGFYGEFIVGDKLYGIDLDPYTNSLGDKVKVYYNPDDPSIVMESPSNLFPILFFIFGSLIVIIAIGLDIFIILVD